MAPGTRRVPGALRYAQLEDWDSPTALYLVEKGTPQGTWLIARPALIKSQEWPDAREVAIPEADGEVIVYEWVKLTGDQPGVMPTKSIFAHLEDQDLEEPTPSPYTLAVLLGNCPEDLRVQPEEFVLSPNGGGASMPQTPDPGVGETTGRDKLDKLLATVEGMATQLTGVVSRVAKLENPHDTRGSARRETRRGTVFFDEEEEEDSDDERPRGSQIPVRKQDERVVDRHGATKPAVERREDQIVVYVDSADGAVGGGGRGIAGLEKERKKVADAPLRRWNRIVAKCSEITDGDGGKGVMTYFKLHTHIKHHRLALKYLHSILHIARCSKEPEVLGHCANALVFLDQMVHNEGMQEVAEQVALFPESQIKYEPLGNRVFPTPEKPYGELVEPDVVAIATRASDDLEKLAARVAKANKPKPKD